MQPSQIDARRAVRNGLAGDDPPGHGRVLSSFALLCRHPSKAAGGAVTPPGQTQEAISPMLFQRTALCALAAPTNRGSYERTEAQHSDQTPRPATPNLHERRKQFEWVHALRPCARIIERADAHGHSHPAPERQLEPSPHSAASRNCETPATCSGRSQRKNWGHAGAGRAVETGRKMNNGR
jgi:hypothetical protein